jgi:hypothetical protein
MVGHAEVLSYGREWMRLHPETAADDLRAVLIARFAKGKDPVNLANYSYRAVFEVRDWLRGLPLIFAGLNQYFNNDDYKGIFKIIEGVVIILTPKPDQG